jgi:hypothetical protein
MTDNASLGVEREPVGQTEQANDQADEVRPRADGEQSELLCTICGLRACWQ